MYAGNNEVVGPHGPGAVFQSWSPSLWMIRTGSCLGATRVGQLLGDIAARVGQGGKEPPQWRAMAAMFMDNPVAADDPRLARTYANLRENLTDICRVGRNAGAAVVLATVAVNLEDFPPVISRHRADLSPEDLGRWESLAKEGSALESAGRGREAIEKFLAAERIDDRYAELPYRLGRCLAAAGDRAAAADRFARSRDLDQLRFRADPHINAAIREAAAGAGEGVYLADAAVALAACGIPDKDLFYEHVHLTFEGNYQLARSVLGPACRALREHLGAPGEGAIPSNTQCAKRLALTPWDEVNMGERVAAETANPPFTNQLDHTVREAARWERLRSLRQAATTPEALRSAWKTYEAALARSKDDWFLIDHFANLAMRCGRPGEAARHWAVLVEKFPQAMTLKLSLGTALLQAGKTDEAVGQFEQARRIKPNSSEVLCGLGTAMTAMGKPKEALAYLEESLRLNPGSSDAHNNLAVLLSREGKTREAIEHYEEALRINPEYADAHLNLGALLQQAGQLPEAIGHYEQAVRLKPDYAQNNPAFASALASARETAAAMERYQKILL
ncbi:MAG: tetratricopeptide repeat protein, partial [Planctomycetota bacterium]|nr:tetratricopeptide repeat protein [Planctomycetota bacterium]